MSEVNAPLTIRGMTPAEAASIAIEWAAKEGWNPGFADAGSFYAADPAGFLLGLLNEEPVACISAVRYGDTYGFLGFYIVKPELRGMGYGMQLWRAGMEHLKGRNIGLDGVLEQVPNYERSGFKAAYRNVRHTGVTADAAHVLGVIALDQVPFKQVLAYDSRHVAVPRPVFLKGWLAAEGSKSLAVVKAGVLKGYGVIRPARDGYKVGPLFADEPIDAERLFSSLLASVPPGEPVSIDIPEVNLEASWLADMYNMTPGFACMRMYNHGTPDLPLENVYGVTCLELG
jgi:ribosomal protein S18 acetylase RimI-like enzyme